MLPSLDREDDDLPSTSDANLERRAPLLRETNLIRVLIIDDHPIVRQGLVQLFSKAPDIEVAGEASSAAQAMDFLASNEADTAVVDLSLDDGSGMDLLSAIRDHHPGTQAIVFSIHDPEIYALRALRAGASGYVSKMQPSEDILTAVRALARGETYPSSGSEKRLVRRSRRDSDNRFDDDIDQLSDRELQVFEMIGKGQSTSEIAKALHLSPKTIETHRKRIKMKLGIETGPKLLIRAAQWVATNA